MVTKKKVKKAAPTTVKAVPVELAAPVVVEQPVTVLSFKGFDAEFKCRGFQYAVGATYTHDGRVEACLSGFHACESPWDVLTYYPLLTDDAKQNKFAIVEQGGKLAHHGEDTKIASATITIKAELSLPQFVARLVTWLIDACKGSDVTAASGDYAKLAASGDSAQLAASGHSAKLAASGHYAKLAASGDSAQLAASGDSAQLAASGKDSVIASSSINSYAKGADGTWIALAEFDGNNKCVGFATGQIGKDGLLPDVWYRAKAGKLVVI